MTHRERDKLEKKGKGRGKARTFLNELGTIARLYLKHIPVRRDKVPRVGEYVLYLLLPRKDRDPIIGDLHEMYFDTIKPKFGPAAAWWWYWAQVVKCLGTLTPVRMVKWAALAAAALRWRS